AVECDLLAPDQRMIESDLGLDAQATPVRTQLAKRFPDSSPNGFEHADVATRLVERLDSDLVDGRDERRRTAIHDRHFRPVNLNDRVIHAKPAQCGKHMLGGGYEWA